MINYTTTNIRTWSRLGSCGAYGIAMQELGETVPNIIAITADLCFYSGLERFKLKYPDRFFNLGIGEQNMVGVASAMAKEGFIPFASTYATFATARACDQVRVNMGYMKQNIKLVGLTAGFSTGILGSTHISIDDVGIMRAIPNITIISPADCTETIKATLASSKHDGPVYLRLTGQMGNTAVYSEDYDFEIGKSIIMQEGRDLTIFASGAMVYESLEASKLLKQDNIECSVINMHTIKPIDELAIKNSTDKKLIVTVEEHSIIGGLGEAVSSCLSKIGNVPPQLFIGVNDTFSKAGSYDFLLRKHNLKADQIAMKIKMAFLNIRNF